jgi:hypothetical protein
MSLTWKLKRLFRRRPTLCDLVKVDFTNLAKLYRERQP